MDNDTGMNGASKPRIEFQPGFLFVDYETEIIRQAYLMYKTVKRTAGFLDISFRKVNKALQRLARSESANLAGAGHGVSPPSSPGGEEKQDSGVRSQDSKAGDGHDG